MKAAAVATLLMLAEVLGFTFLLGVFSPPFWAFLGGGMVGLLGGWLLYGLAAIALGAALGRLQRGEGLGALGFRYHRGFWSDVGAGVVAYALLYLATLPFDVAVFSDRVGNLAALLGQFGLRSPAQVLGGGGLLALVLGFITGTFHEEIRFRGYYQGVGSRETTPLAGFVMALVPFSMGHYFAQPDWSPGQVLATIVPGIVYGLLYHATGSLVAVMTTHTLANWLGAYPSLMVVATGSRAAGHTTAAGLGLVLALVVYLRRAAEVQEIVTAARAMLRDRPLLGLVAGAVSGAALLGSWPLRSSSWPCLFAGLALVGVAIVGKRARRGERSGGGPTG
jgi:membrane protease YdiL (CAAX protease family)